MIKIDLLLQDDNTYIISGFILLVSFYEHTLLIHRRQQNRGYHFYVTLKLINRHMYEEEETFICTLRHTERQTLYNNEY